jgi:hypothetical protein
MPQKKNRPEETSPSCGRSQSFIGLRPAAMRFWHEYRRLILGALTACDAEMETMRRQRTRKERRWELLIMLLREHTVSHSE